MDTSKKIITDVSKVTADTERRKFVKNMAVATSGLALSQFAFPVFSSGQVKEVGSRALKIGVLGLGGRGAGATLNALAADKNAVIWAVGELFDDKLKKGVKRIQSKKSFASQINVPPERQFVGFDAYQKVLDSGVDMVILATPPVFRPLHMKAAVEAGVHVFAEKPLAVDMVGMKSVIDTANVAKAKGVSIMTGLVWRYTPSLMELHQRINDGEIGDVVHASSSYSGGRPNIIPPAKYRPKDMSDLEWSLRYWQNFKEFSGDGIMEFMIHGIDRLSWAWGHKKPVACYAQGANSVPIEGSNVWDQFSLFFEYEDGARSTFFGRQIAQTYGPRGDYILGTKGEVFVDGYQNKQQIVIKKDNKVVWSKPIGKLGFVKEHQILNQHIRQGQVYNDILGEMEIGHIMGLMGRSAAYTGRLLTWENMLDSQESYIDVENMSFSDSFTPQQLSAPGQTRFV